jgi:hypothetical protein
MLSDEQVKQPELAAPSRGRWKQLGESCIARSLDWTEHLRQGMT